MALNAAAVAVPRQQRRSRRGEDGSQFEPKMGLIENTMATIENRLSRKTVGAVCRCSYCKHMEQQRQC